jgi:hypothetical protein
LHSKVLQSECNTPPSDVKNTVAPATNSHTKNTYCIFIFSLL